MPLWSRIWHLITLEALSSLSCCDYTFSGFPLLAGFYLTVCFEHYPKIKYQTSLELPFRLLVSSYILSLGTLCYAIQTDYYLEYDHINISLSKADLFSNFQTHIFRCLPDVSIWESQWHLKLSAHTKHSIHLQRQLLSNMSCIGICYHHPPSSYTTQKTSSHSPHVSLSTHISWF